MSKKSFMNPIAGTFLQFMAKQLNKQKFNVYLYNSDGPINFCVGVKTDTETVNKAIKFYNGRASVLSNIPTNNDVIIRFKNDASLIKILHIKPDEIQSFIINNIIILDGNLTYFQLFNYYVSLLLDKRHAKMLSKKIKADKLKRKQLYSSMSSKNIDNEFDKRSKDMLKGDPTDKNVKILNDPYLSEYSIEDFPRLKGFLDNHFNTKPKICSERPKLLTEWFRKNGFNKDDTGHFWNPEKRQAFAFKYLMENRKPIIADNDLIAGTTTSKLPTGILLYPDSQGTMIWGELETISKRIFNPYDITEEDKNTLNDIFPYWAKRNFREVVHNNYNNPLCQQIDDRKIFYFVWKSVGISHTIPDFESLLKRGTLDYIKEINEKLQTDDLKLVQKYTLEAMVIVLKGVNAYAKNLSREAKRKADNATDPARKNELLELSEICTKVPMQPAKTLYEAINSIWITWIAIHMENTNRGLSLGRLDQWLQPYFLKDIKKLQTEAEQKAYISKVIELIGCFYMRCTDHLPSSSDIENYLSGGNSSNQAITLGGITPDGKDAVCDMTYIFLKVTEMLSIRDPNVNARYNEKNSSTYLKRLCEVNYITAATPSMHNDTAVIKALSQHQYPIKDVNNWSSTSCVEPTISGKHMGHTGSILMNMVSALEMALNDGIHPNMNWRPGAATGNVEKFETFDQFFNAYKRQQKFLIDRAVELDTMLATVHSAYRPTPLLSTFIQGSIEKALDITKGGAKYNTSGSSNIGLAEVTDSMLVIKKLVFEDKIITFTELKNAIDKNFKGYEDLQTYINKKIPMFSSGDKEAVKMANSIAKFIHNTYASHKNFRSGKYTSGFCSMSQHAIYGNPTSALPFGKTVKPRLPQSFDSKSFLNDISYVAHLDPENMDNNQAFNVRLAPSPNSNHKNIIDNMESYVKEYFDMGGMQIQFNVINSDTLKDAVAHPENYKNLLVNISGYNAYFVNLNREMQIKIIESAEYEI